MKSKILIFGVITAIALIAVFFAMQKEEVKVHDVNEAINIVKEKYPEFIDVINTTKNLTIENTSSGWRIEINVSSNTTPEAKNITTIFVYKNGTIEKTQETIFIKELTEEEAITLIKEKYPEFKNIKKCEFEEKLMCHEDIITEKINDKWNITFMNESKGCNNECVIEHYYSFVVDKDGKIIRLADRDKTIGLSGIFHKKVKYAVNTPPFFTAIKYMENKSGKKWASAEFPGCSYEFFGRCDEKIGCYLPWNAQLITCRADSITFSFFVNEDENTIYELNESTYNLLFEKFSIKTIENEKDVLEAFERYWNLFGVGYDRHVFWKIDEIRGSFVTVWGSFDDGVKNIKKGGEGFEDRLKPKIVKEKSYWKANLSAFYIDGTYIEIFDYNVIITERGAVMVLNKTNTARSFIFEPI